MNMQVKHVRFVIEQMDSLQIINAESYQGYYSKWN